MRAPAKFALGAIGVGAVSGVLWLSQAPAYHGPSGGSAVCDDGTISYSQHSSGTCSWHGGVKAWNGADRFDRILHRHPPLPND
jgi:hypothetical protein